MSAKSHGIGSVWGQVTRTATHSFSAVGSVASAMDGLSQNLELRAWLSVGQSAVDIVEEMGIKNEDGTPVNPAQALVTTQAMLKSLRGY
jgi:hypothetical protein